MPHYRVALRGQNFRLDIEGQPSRVGFFTYRFVEAASAEDAELGAVQLLRDEGRLKPRNDKADPPHVFIDTIEPVEAADVPKVVPGFAFFPDEPDSEA